MAVADLPEYSRRRRRIRQNGVGIMILLAVVIGTVIMSGITKSNCNTDCTRNLASGKTQTEKKTEQKASTMIVFSISAARHRRDLSGASAESPKPSKVFEFGLRFGA